MMRSGAANQARQFEFGGDVYPRIGRERNGKARCAKAFDLDLERA